MDHFKKMLIIIVLISFFAVQFPRTGFAWPNPSYVKTAKATGITRHDPEFLAPPELSIPVETETPGKSLKKGKMNKWLWIGVGVVAAGAAAALGGGGGDSGSSGAGTGTIDIVGPAP